MRGGIAPLDALSRCELALGVALLWPDVAPPDDIDPPVLIEPDVLLFIWRLVALLSCVLLLLGLEVCARAGSAAAIKAARATLPRSFFIVLPFLASWIVDVKKGRAMASKQMERARVPPSPDGSAPIPHPRRTSPVFHAE